MENSYAVSPEWVQLCLSGQLKPEGKCHSYLEKKSHASCSRATPTQAP